MWTSTKYLSSKLYKVLVIIIIIIIYLFKFIVVCVRHIIEYIGIFKKWQPVLLEAKQAEPKDIIRKAILRFVL